MSARRLGLFIVLLLFATSACGVPSDSRARVDMDTNVPSGLLDRGTVAGSSPPTSPGTVSASVCLVAVDGRLRYALRRFPSTPTVDVLLQSLADPPDATESAADLSTALSPEISGSDVALEAGVATVGLAAEFAKAPADLQLQAVAQIVCTLTDQPGIGQVHFTLEGAAVEVDRIRGARVVRAQVR
jgi:spore germination protein GerM